MRGFPVYHSWRDMGFGKEEGGGERIGCVDCEGTRVEDRRRFEGGFMMGE